MDREKRIITSPSISIREGGLSPEYEKKSKEDVKLLREMKMTDKEKLDLLNDPQVLEIKKYAFDRHHTQSYGDQPYSYHLDGVAKNVIIKGKNKEECIFLAKCAYLHDIVEDYRYTVIVLEDIVDIDISIAKIIDLLSCKGYDSYGQLMVDYTYSEYIKRISRNKIAIKVKLADLEFNIKESKKSLEDPLIKSKSTKYIKQRLDKYELATMYLTVKE